MIDITHAKQRLSSLTPLEWTPIMSDGIWTARMTCSKGHMAGLGDHAIAEDGKVSPSVECPAEDCGFHESVRLVDWKS